MELSNQCACCGKNLDRFLQPVILAILTNGPSTGYAIVKKIPSYSTFRDGGPDPTGVYRYLKLMQAKGMLYKPEEGDDVSPYSITELGRECLENWRETLLNYQSQIGSLIGQLDERLASSAPDNDSIGP